MTVHLRARLTVAEETFVSALSKGEVAMEDFSQSWISLVQDLEFALNRNDIDIETLSLASEVATRVNALAAPLLMLHEEAEGVTASLRSDIEDVFAKFSLEEQASSASSITHITKNDRHPSPPYIQSAHSWLIANLHNPYPSKETRLSIAQQTNTDVKDIERWFISARKSIGWNALRAEHFSNKRSDIVDAATLFFKDLPPSQTRNENNFFFRFIKIENEAKAMYSRVDIGDCSPLFPVKTAGRLKRSKRSSAAQSYPSPETSPDRSPGPPSPISLSDNQPVQGQNRRRRRDSDICDEHLRPAKLPRLDPAVKNDPAAKLPSPAPSLVELSCDSDDGFVTSVQPTCQSPSRKRKRRLSDSEGGVFKRPHTISFPRLQAVSDPFPAKTPIIEDNYGSTNLNDIPSPVFAIPFDDWSTFDVDSHRLSLLTADIEQRPYETNVQHSALPSTSLQLPPSDVHSSEFQDHGKIIPFDLPDINCPTIDFGILADMSSFGPLDSTFVSGLSLAWPDCEPYTLQFPEEHNGATNPTSINDGKAAKLERLQKLRQELQQLEASIS